MNPTEKLNRNAMNNKQMNKKLEINNILKLVNW